MAGIGEFVDLLHQMFEDPEGKGRVAKAFQPHADELEDLLGAQDPDTPEEPLGGTCTDFDEIEDFVTALMDAFSEDVGEVIAAFKGRRKFLEQLIATIEAGDFGAGEANGDAKNINTFSAADEGDIVALIEKIASPLATTTTKAQSAALFRSNLWVKKENPQLILEHRGITVLLEAVEAQPDEEEFIVKCCQAMEALFDYKGVDKVVCASSKAVINGNKYVIAAGKTWDPINFVCWRSGKSIPDAFYIIDQKPHAPESLTAEERGRLKEFSCKWVEDNTQANPGAAIPFIDQLLENDGLNRLVSTLAANLRSSGDEYGVTASSKLFKKMAEVDPDYQEAFIDRLAAIPDSPSQDEICKATLYCCILQMQTVWTAAVLAPHSATLTAKLEALRQGEEGKANPVFLLKSAAVLKRLSG